MHYVQRKDLCDWMESKLIKKLMDAGSRSSSLEFFTNRPEIVVAKQHDQPAEVEYICPFCKFYEIKNIEMVKGKRKFARPKFNCSKCGKAIEVLDLKKSK